MRYAADKAEGIAKKQVGEMLRGEGLDIATPTLKTYLLTKKRRKTQPAPTAQKTARASSMPSSASTPSTPAPTVSGAEGKKAEEDTSSN
jgi:hypothetical protein